LHNRSPFDKLRANDFKNPLPTFALASFGGQAVVPVRHSFSGGASLSNHFNGFLSYVKSYNECLMVRGFYNRVPHEK
jgi:hypothetical protein